MKRTLVLAIFLTLLGFVILNLSLMHVTVAKSTPDSADLTSLQLETFKNRAINEGNLQAAARVYWYYRFTKRDPAETEKWQAIVNRLDTKIKGTR